MARSNLRVAPPPAGFATVSGDCDDADPTVHPGALRECESGFDIDCDGSIAEACGEQDLDAFLDYGFVIDSAGDVNGDGIDDVVLVAGDGRYAPVMTRIILGQEDLSREDKSGLTDGEIKPEQWGGYDWAWVPDADGDGLDELLLGISDFGEVTGYEGRAYLISGEEIMGGLYATEQAKHYVVGAEVNAYFGSPVEAIRAPGDSAAGVFAAADWREASVGIGGTGSIRLFRSAGVLASPDPLSSDAPDGVILAGIDQNLGSRVANIGDIDADGLDDIAVTDWGGAPNLGVYVFSTADVLSGASGTADAIAALTRVDSDYQAMDLQGVGDLDGDGIPDLGLGIGGTDATPWSLGIFQGGDIIGAKGAVPTGASIVGWTSAETEAVSFAGSGDMDGSGRADLVAAYGTVAFVIDGASVPWGGTGNAADLAIRFEDPNAAWYWLGAGGDINGDDAPDVILSSGENAVIFGW